MKKMPKHLFTMMLLSGLILTSSAIGNAATLTPIGADYVKPNNTTINIDAATASMKDKKSGQDQPAQDPADLQRHL